MSGGGGGGVARTEYIEEMNNGDLERRVEEKRLEEMKEQEKGWKRSTRKGKVRTCYERGRK